MATRQLTRHSGDPYRTPCPINGPMNLVVELEARFFLTNQEIAYRGSWQTECHSYPSSLKGPRSSLPLRSPSFFPSATVTCAIA